MSSGDMRQTGASQQKQKQKGGQDGRKQENHLGENEQIKKQENNPRKNHRKGKYRKYNY